MQRNAFFLSLLLLALSSSCASLTPAVSDGDQLQDPGFFDIGFGHARVMDTRGGDNDDAEGQMVSFKAYPLGRWYSEPKSAARQAGVSADDKVAAYHLRGLDPMGRAAFFRLEDAGVTEDAHAAFARDLEAFMNLPKADRFSIDQAADLLDSSKRVQARTQHAAAAPSGNAAASAQYKAFEKLLAKDARLEDHVRTTLTIKDRSRAREAREQVERMLSSSSVKILGTQRLSLSLLTSPEQLDAEQKQSLKSFLESEALPPKWRIHADRQKWYNRLSVFYGRSVGDFDSGGLESEVNAIGIGFDVSPDLALQVGLAFYEVDETGLGDIDSDSSLFVGVSLNLYAFRSFLSALGTAAQE